MIDLSPELKYLISLTTYYCIPDHRLYYYSGGYWSPDFRLFSCSLIAFIFEYAGIPDYMVFQRDIFDFTCNKLHLSKPLQAGTQRECVNSWATPSFFFQSANMKTIREDAIIVFKIMLHTMEKSTNSSQEWLGHKCCPGGYRWKSSTSNNYIPAWPIGFGFPELDKKLSSPVFFNKAYSFFLSDFLEIQFYWTRFSPGFWNIDFKHL